MDVDNYFDNIDHKVLFSRVKSIIPCSEILRLLELSTKMGMVSTKLQWEEIEKGVPQGAIISPILANFYLHSFDQFVLSRDVKYVRYADDDVGFLFRERKGATDLVNSMLNYGYSILYARIWRELLKRKLNPTDSVLHEVNNGKPTFVYDVIELFRCQAVDRVVISLVQKGEQLHIKKGLLTEETKKLLVANIIERINKYETYRGENIKFLEVINRQVREISLFISEDEKFKPYIAKW